MKSQVKEIQMPVFKEIRYNLWSVACGSQKWEVRRLAACDQRRIPSCFQARLVEKAGQPVRSDTPPIERRSWETCLEAIKRSANAAVLIDEKAVARQFAVEELEKALRACMSDMRTYIGGFGQLESFKNAAATLALLEGSR